MKSFWSVLPEDKINQVLSQLPLAKESMIIRTDKGTVIDFWKAIIVNDEVVDIPTKHYELVQSTDAFNPVIEGVKTSGLPFKFSVWFDNRQARLALLVGDSKDGVSYGFKITNSFDRSLSINFGYEAKHRYAEIDMVEREHVTLWGFRQVCENGMIAKVPLESTKYVTPELRIKVKSLIAGNSRILHLASAVDKIKQTKYVVEALLLLKPSLDLMVSDAQNYKISTEQIKIFLDKYVGVRKHEHYLKNFFDEGGDNLWALFNSITHYASHDEDLRISQRERILNKAADLLMNVLVE